MLHSTNVINRPVKLNLRIAAFLMVLLSLVIPNFSAAQEGEVTLNFKDADIRSIAEMVSKATGKNFLLDPRVKGNVTMVSAQPVPVELLYDTFLSILAVHGMSAVADGNVVRIVPAASAFTGAEFGEITESEPFQGEMRVTVLPVKHVDADQLVPLLRPLVAKNGHLASSASSNVLIVADTARGISRLTEVLKTIDLPNNSQKILFFPLKHAAASKVANAIAPLLKSPGKATDKVAVTSDDRTNTLMVSGADATIIARLREMISHLDAPTDNVGDTKVIFLNYAKASELAEILRKFAQDIQEQKQKTDKDLRPASVGIQPNDSINALLITAKPDDMQTLLQVIESMDIERAQVLVESLIVEISDETARKLGIQWVATDDNLLDLETAALLSSQALTSGTLLGRISTDSDLSIGVLARALATNTDANIISTPSLITMDNKEASISVGREVPFLTGSFTSTGTDSNPTNPFNTVQRSNVGLTLKILPQINKGSVIRMDIEQEISSLLPGAAEELGATDVVTSVRTIQTSVSVADGNMLVLGGLVDDTLTEGSSKIPLLGDVPLFGELFTYRETKKDKRNLMIFIRPRILRDSVSSSSLSREKYEQIRNVQLETREQQLSEKNKLFNLLPYHEMSIIDPLEADAAPPAQPKSPAAPEILQLEETSSANDKPSSYEQLFPDF